MKNTLIATGLCLFVLVACGGKSESPDNEKPVAESYSLGEGTYVIEGGLSDVNDQCKIDVMNPEQPITDLTFQVKSLGSDKYTLDFCGTLVGPVEDNVGKLVARHDPYLRQDGDTEGTFTRDCSLVLMLTADNAFEAEYKEVQSNRSAVIRNTTVDLDSCTTSFRFKLVKKP